MTREQLEEIEKLAVDFKSATFHDLMARQTLPLVKALREARAEVERLKAALEWARVACFRLESERNQAVKDRDASYDAVESARATIRHAQAQKCKAIRQRDAARTEVKRMRSAISQFVNQYPWQQGPEIQELKALAGKGDT